MVIPDCGLVHRLLKALCIREASRRIQHFVLYQEVSELSILGRTFTEHSRYCLERVGLQLDDTLQGAHSSVYQLHRDQIETLFPRRGPVAIDHRRVVTADQPTYHLFCQSQEACVETDNVPCDWASVYGPLDDWRIENPSLIPDPDEASVVECTTADLIRALRVVDLATGRWEPDDPSIYHRHHLFFVQGKIDIDSTIHLKATDGHLLGLATISGMRRGRVDETLFRLPPQRLGRLLERFGTDTTIISVANERLICQSGPLRYAFDLADPNYRFPNYEPIVERILSSDHALVFEPGGWALEGVTQALAEYKKNQSGIQLSFDDSGLGKIHVTRPHYIRRRPDFTEDKCLFRVSFNPKYLRLALRAFTGPVTLRYRSRNEAVAFCQDDRNVLLMPMRLHDEADYQVFMLETGDES